MTRLDVIAEIAAAFRDVALDEGIGILESEAIDSYLSDEKRRVARENDYREKWDDIPERVIAQYYSALCFMDARGLRFNLPAYMTFALRNYDKSGSASINATITALCREPEELQREWSIFSLRQRKAIAHFLRYMVTEVGERWVDSWQASLSYEKTWCLYDGE
jgi:hypothetical protein